MAFLVCLLVTTSTGCGYSANEKLGGKFAFVTTRYTSVEKPAWYQCILEKGKIRKLSDKYGGGIWSADGKRLTCMTTEGIAIIDDQGNELESIKTPYKIVSMGADRQGRIIVYSADNPLDRTNRQYYVYVYDTIAKENRLLYTPDVNHAPHNFSLSKDCNKILFSESEIPGKNSTVYLMDVKTGIKQTIWEGADSPAWFPDGENILLCTNKTKKGETITGFFGVLLKVNLSTLDYQILEQINEMKMYFRVSKDGKYLYYSKPLPKYKKSRAIVVAPLDNLDKEIVVTTPVPIVTSQGTLLEYSQDFGADWYQGE